MIRELLAAANAGGGFVEYYWIKPGEQGGRAKLGYVELFRARTTSSGPGSIFGEP